MITLQIPGVLLLALIQGQFGRLVPARASCSGPLQGFEVTWPDGSTVRARIELGAGEERGLELWLPLPAAGAVGSPELSVVGAGSVRLEPWPDARGRELSEAWQRVPPGLRQRPPPPLPDDGGASGRLPPSALLAAGACLALVLGLRARPRAALGAGALGGVLALSLAAPLVSAPRASEVLEGNGAGWVLVRAARSRLVLGEEPVARLDAVPSEVALRVAGTDGAWEIEAPGTLLVARRPLEDLDGAGLDPANNGIEDLPRCWLRGPDGLWSHRGRWARGEPLPEARPGPAPPAGLIAGLPQGRGVLLAERARPEHADSTRAWLRLVGFPPVVGDRH